MPANDREVFRHLSEDVNTPTQIDMMAFALFFFEKEEWCRLYEQKNNQPPTQNDIDNFTSDYTPERLKRLRIDAVTYFDRAAREYLEDEIEAEKKEVLESAIVREVKSSGGFWRQFGLAVVTSILAPLVLALMLLAGSYVKDIPSPSDIASKLPRGRTMPNQNLQVPPPSDGKPSEK